MTVWKREVEAPEVRDQGYLRLLQTRSPGETFRGEQSAFKAQGGEGNAEGKCSCLGSVGTVEGWHQQVPDPGRGPEEDWTCGLEVRCAQPVISSLRPLLQ